MISEQTRGCWTGIDHSYPIFLKFLDDAIGDADSIAALQEFLGYCLLRRNLFAKALLITGPGGSGKTTLCKIIEGLFGTEACGFVSFSGIRAVFSLAKLADKQVNFITDPENIDPSVFKSFVSGDQILARSMYSGVFIYDPYCRLVITGQSEPWFMDDPSMRCRVIHIQMTASRPSAVNPDLVSSVLDERRGICQFMMAGLERLLKNRKFTGQD